MESQPQNPEFRINPENFHPCSILCTDPTSHRAAKMIFTILPNLTVF